MREFAGRFLESRRDEIDAIPGLLAEDRLDLVARVGHQIKGTAPTFGLAEIGAAGARLESAARDGDTEAVLQEMEILRRLMGQP